jgi:UDP-galactopyranose mutase
MCVDAVRFTAGFMKVGKSTKKDYATVSNLGDKMIERILRYLVKKLLKGYSIHKNPPKGRRKVAH